MTTETKRAAEASLAQIEEVTSVVLPEPACVGDDPRIRPFCQ